MSRPLRRRITAFVCTILTLMQPLAGGGCFFFPAPGLSLSATSLDPGAMFSIFDGGLVAGTTRIVRFSGPNEFSMALAIQVTEEGVLRLSAPPIFDVGSGQFAAGDLVVSVDGLAGTQSLHVNALTAAPLGGAPGDLLRAFLQFASDEHAAQITAIDALAAQYGTTPDVEKTRAAHQAGIDYYADLLQQLDLFGDLSLTLPMAGLTFANEEELTIADQLIAANLNSALAELEAAGVSTAKLIRADATITEDPYAFATETLRALRDSAANGVLTLGAFLAGSLSLFAVYEGMTATIATAATAAAVETVAGGLAIVAIAFTGIHAAVMTFGSDSAISAMQGLEADAYRDGKKALTILRDTATDVLKSVGLIFVDNTLLDGLDGFKNYYDALQHWGKTACQNPGGNRKIPTTTFAAPSAEFCEAVTGLIDALGGACTSDAATYLISGFDNFEGLTHFNFPGQESQYASLADVCITGPPSAPMFRWKTTAFGGAVHAYAVTIGYDAGDPWDYRASGETNATVFLTQPITGGQADTADTTVFGAFRTLTPGHLYSVTVRANTPDGNGNAASLLFMVR